MILAYIVLLAVLTYWLTGFLWRLLNRWIDSWPTLTRGQAIRLINQRSARD